MNPNKLNWYVSFIVPLIGVGIFGWNAFSIILFFCFESFLLGAFLVIKGLVGIYHTRKLKGVIFLLLFCGIYFIHLFALTVLIGSVGEHFGIIVLPSLVSIIGSILILLIPNVFEVIALSKAMAKERGDITKIDLSAGADMILDFKETMFKVFILWLIQPVVWGIIFLDSYTRLPSIVTSLIVIAIFCAVRYWVESKSQRDREIVHKHIQQMSL